MDQSGQQLVDLARQHKKAFEGMIAQGGSKVEDTVYVMDNAFFRASAALHGAKPTEHLEHLEATQFLLARAMKTFHSLRILIEFGCSQDAAALSRLFAETRVTLQYLTEQNSDELFGLFRNYEKIERTKNYYKSIEIGVDHVIRPDLLAEAKAYREALKEKYGKEQAAKLLKSWSGESLDKLYKSLEQSNEYVSSYSTGSMLVHPSFLSRHQYHKDGDGRASWEPTWRWANQHGLVATMELGRVVTAFTSFHGLHEIKKNLVTEINWNVLSRLEPEKLRKGYPGLQVTPPGKWYSFPDDAEEIPPTGSGES